LRAPVQIIIDYDSIASEAFNPVNDVIKRFTIRSISKSWPM